MAYSGNAVAILGLSYCGSTVLNYVFDTHPAIYGGSELYRLYAPNMNPYCAVCGPACPYWTESALNRFQGMERADLYENLASLFGAGIICDSSKQLSHFRKQMEGDARTRFTFVILRKHPIRHIASFVTNDLLKKKRILEPSAIAQAQTALEQEMIDFAIDAAHRIRRFISSLDRRIKELCGHGSVVHVSYESLIQNLPSALAPVLDDLNLAFTDVMADYSSHEHHPLGGNMGPHIQTNCRHGRPVALNGTPRYRRDFYETSTKLRIDDKYRHTFSERQLELLMQLPIIHHLCEELNYAVDPSEVTNQGYAHGF